MPSTTSGKAPGLPEGGKARRVYLLLQEEILRGQHAPGGLLDGEQKLAQRLGVSRVTIRRALDALAQDGMITRRAGSGTVVQAQASQPPVRADFTTLIPQLVEFDQKTTARLLSFSYGTAPASVAEAMGLPLDGRVQTAVRVRLAQGRPFSHLTTYVPEAIAENYTEADLASTPLFRLLERSGVSIERAHQSVSATLAAPDVADVLGLSVGAPVLSLNRVVMDDKGQGVEYLSALYRPDMFRLEMSLNRVGADDTRHWAPVIDMPNAEAAE